MFTAHAFADIYKCTGDGGAPTFVDSNTKANYRNCQLIMRDNATQSASSKQTIAAPSNFLLHSDQTLAASTNTTDLPQRAYAPSAPTRAPCRFVRPPPSPLVTLSQGLGATSTLCPPRSWTTAGLLPRPLISRPAPAWHRASSAAGRGGTVSGRGRPTVP